jgi:hypothetical protein
MFMPYLKYKFKYTIFLVFISLFVFFGTNANAIDKQVIEYKDAVLRENIITVRMHLEDWEVSWPILDLSTNNKLLFSFDLIDESPDEFFYTIIHCNADWTPSNLMFFEYAGGFEENNIIDYQSSYNTFVSYTHYRVSLPNEDININIPGNYLFVVYTKESGVPEIAITSRFMVLDNILEISGRVNAPVDNSHRNTSQKVDFRISRHNFHVNDVFREFKIVIMQNFQWHNTIEDLEPSFINNDEFVYEFDERNVFKASNEYRYFTFHDTEMLSEKVERIEFRSPYYYIRLFPDVSGLFRRYSSSEDINGRYVIRTRRFTAADYPETESDYGLVHFQLIYDVPVDNSNVYIYGELSNREISEKYRMKYNLETRAYEKILLLKQGYYNYRYILVDDNNIKPPDHTFIEGSHFQTENDYLIFVYHRAPGRNYDRLIGYKQLNSRN